MKLLDIVDTLNTWAARIAAVILAGMVLLILVEILMWNTLTRSTIIADEYAAYGLAAIVFLGAGFCLQQRGHIRISLVLSFLPRTAARAITFVVTVLCTVFMGYLVLQLWWMTGDAFRYGSTSGTLSNTRLWIPQGIMLLGAILFFLQLAAFSVRTFRGVGDREDVF